MAIREILNKARNIYYVTIHKDGESKHMSLDELTDKEYDLEFEWFEVTTFWGKDVSNLICKTKGNNNETRWKMYMDIL